MNTRLASLSLSLMLAMGSMSPAMAGDRFSISGVIPGVTDSLKVVLLNMEDDSAGPIAETVSTDGNFTLAGKVKMPTMCRLSYCQRSQKGYALSRMRGPRIMVENSDIIVSFSQSGDSVSNSEYPEKLMSVKGSSSNDQFVRYLEKCGDAELEAKLAGYQNAQKWMESMNHPDTMAIYDRIKSQAEHRLVEAQREFIASHPEYHVSAFLVLKELSKIFAYTGHELTEMAEKVRVCPDTARVNLIDRTYNNAMKHCLGIRFYDFNVDNVNGESKPFSGYVTPGKYTFMDFWASWCGPCRSAIPHVRKLHEQYGERINIYSISCDEEMDAWRKAMDEEKMGWTQLRLNPDQIREAAGKYMISTIPRLILLDERGNIVCSTHLPAVIDTYLAKNIK